MKRILYLTIFVITLSASYYFYYKLDMYARLKSVIVKKLQYAIDSSGYNDILFIGSSRTFVHVDPRIIDSVNGIQSYNLGLDGSSIIEQQSILKRYIEKHPIPKLVVISLDFLTLDTEKDVYNYPDYFPFVSKDDPLRMYLSAHHAVYNRRLLFTWHRWKQLSELPDSIKLKVLFSSDQWLNTHYMGFTRKEYGDYYKGFQPNYKEWEGNKKTGTGFSIPITESGKKILEELVQNCQQRKIKLVFMYPPFYDHIQHSINNYKTLDQFFRTIAIKYKISFLDYTDAPICSQKDLFYNYEHLNARGAAIFSDILARDIKQLLPHE